MSAGPDDGIGTRWMSLLLLLLSLLISILKNRNAEEAMATKQSGGARLSPPVSTELSLRSEEDRNLLLDSSSSKEIVEQELPVAWYKQCQHGRWHSYAGAAFCLVVALVICVPFLSYEVFSRWASRGLHPWGTSRPLQKLDKPVVILVSSDGFRFGYNWKAATPNIDRLRMEGTEADPGMIPVFPSKTFPNHYSIATGLYPAYHGIVGNYFRDPNPGSNDTFKPGELDPKWWLGEPIWETVVNQGLQAATYFWPGSQVKKGNWTCESRFCQDYNSSVPYEDRVDTVLGYLDLPSRERPSLITLYFESPDEPGHETGPDAPQITAAVVRIDTMIGRLLAGLEKRGLDNDVTIILVGDHGMVGKSEDKMIYLEDLASEVLIPREWVMDYTPVLHIRPPPNLDVTTIHSSMARALTSSNMNNAEFLEIYLKEQLPPRLHYSHSPRIAPIVGLVAEGYTLAYARTDKPITCGGEHGYDNVLLSMRTIFIARGPQFAQGRRIPSFENVELYEIMANILGLTPAPNNASLNFAASVLLPLRS